jgi:hypothetical protein
MSLTVSPSCVVAVQELSQIQAVVTLYVDVIHILDMSIKLLNVEASVLYITCRHLLGILRLSLMSCLQTHLEFDYWITFWRCVKLTIWLSCWDMTDLTDFKLSLACLLPLDQTSSVPDLTWWEGHLHCMLVSWAIPTAIYIPSYFDHDLHYPYSIIQIHLSTNQRGLA